MTHLNRRRERRGPLGQDVGLILARVLAPGEEQGDVVSVAGGDDARGEHGLKTRGRTVRDANVLILADVNAALDSAGSSRRR
jgi:hypothetical protein